jgi:hypothetical protein
MDETAISRYITETFDGVETISMTGNTFFFYGPEHKFPFVTLVTNDEYDNDSDLQRPGVFRLNIGVRKPTFQALFATDTAHDPDFTALDRLLPHPVYGKMFWVSILNPSTTTFTSSVQPLLAEAYEIAVARDTRRAKQG